MRVARPPRRPMRVARPRLCLTACDHPSIRILDDAQLDLVLDEALRILEEVGVKVAGEPMRSRLFDAGYQVHESSGRVLFPRDKVRAAMATVPSSFMLHDRDGAEYAEFGVGVSHFAPGSSGSSLTCGVSTCCCGTRRPSSAAYSASTSSHAWCS